MIGHGGKKLEKIDNLRCIKYLFGFSGKISVRIITCVLCKILNKMGLVIVSLNNSQSYAHFDGYKIKRFFIIYPGYPSRY
jgi:hypothetical protein